MTHAASLSTVLHMKLVLLMLLHFGNLCRLIIQLTRGQDHIYTFFLARLGAQLTICAQK